MHPIAQAPSGEKILAVIQARCRSSRLPGKPLLELAGRPMLAHVIERIRCCRLVGQLIVATTVQHDDLAIVRLCADMGIGVYCGEADDPLERYYRAARLYGADHVVRIKSDCPMIDFSIVDQAIRLHLDQHADYTTNTLERTYPVGQDVEILTRPTLEKVWQDANLMSEREHITLYLPKHPESFRICHLKQVADLSCKRWTIDYPEDYQVAKEIFRNLYPQDAYFGMEAILAFLARRPELEAINAHIPVDAGVQASLARDRPAAPTR